MLSVLFVVGQVLNWSKRLITSVVSRSVDSLLLVVSIRYHRQEDWGSVFRVLRGLVGDL